MTVVFTNKNSGSIDDVRAAFRSLSTDSSETALDVYIGADVNVVYYDDIILEIFKTINRCHSLIKVEIYSKHYAKTQDRVKHYLEYSYKVAQPRVIPTVLVWDGVSAFRTSLFDSGNRIQKVDFRTSDLVDYRINTKELSGSDYLAIEAILMKTIESGLAIKLSNH